MTKEETLNFIAYLQSKENILVESQPIMFRTWFRLIKTDLYTEASEVAEIIKKSSSPVVVYNAVASTYAKQNSSWKMIPGFGHIFIEDLAEYLDGFGISDSMEYADKITHRETHNSSVNKEIFSEEFRQYIGCGRPLRSRDIFIKLFPTEYLNYKFSLCNPKDSKYITEKMRIKGNPNGTRYEVANVEHYCDPNRILIVYDSKLNSITESELASLGKFICENYNQTRVTLKDRQKDEVTIIRKEVE